MKSFGNCCQALTFGIAAVVLGACQGNSVTPQPPSFGGTSEVKAPKSLEQGHQPKRHPNYSVVILHGLGGSFNSSLGINGGADVSGFSSLPGSQLIFHATLWRKGVATDLGTLGGNWSGISPAGFNEAHSISASDVVTGESETATPDPNSENACGISGLECRAFLWKHGSMIALPTLGGNNAESTAINNRGQVVGVSETSAPQNCQSVFLYIFFGFVWDKGQMTQLPPESGDADTIAAGINDSGDVVGTSGSCLVAAHSVLWRKGKVIDLGNLGGTNGNAPAHINNREQVVGAAQIPNGDTHAFLWQRGVMSDLGTLPGDVNSIANSINQKSQIAGYSFDAYGNVRAVLWSGGAVYDLNTLVPPSSGIFLQEALDINARGQIAGFGCAKCDGSDQLAFLATPTGSYSSGNAIKSKLPLSGHSLVGTGNAVRGWSGARGRHRRAHRADLRATLSLTVGPWMPSR